MRAADLDLHELLEIPPAGGILRFAGRRAVLLDAVALGLLRSELIHTLGRTAARGILTRFGYAHGWRTAEAMKDAFPWDSEADWKRAGGRLHTLQGLVTFEPVEPSGPGPAPFAEAIWKDSYEAEQHVLGNAPSDEPVCWTLTGFASGYMSYCNGRDVYCIEDRCRGKGDPVCHVIGRPKEDWGDEIGPHLTFFQEGCLEKAVQYLTTTLKETERKLLRRERQLRRDAGDTVDPSGIIARSTAMEKLLQLARKLAPVDTSVLITGESGSGKERIARLVHDESGRAHGPFVAVNCAAVSESLLESELFGHARGAFTGATADRAGLFEAASGGTLFLDEVGEIPMPMQAKLLRALQEKEVRRVGENKNRPIDVRVVAATNRDLGEDVAGGAFRKDLYYRLRVVELRVPPLRERKEDLLPLARLFLAEAARRTGRRVTGLTPRAADQLLRHDWPGNVRELENAIERAVVLAAGDRVDVDDLPEEIRVALPVVYHAGVVRTLDEVERDYTLAVLERNGGHQAKTAKELGIGTATLYRKLRDWRAGERKIVATRAPRRR
jgi:two-component system, NtrC family, response regulator HydG